MSNFYIEYHRRKDGQGIVNYDALELYCKQYNQKNDKIVNVLSSFDRVEYYIYNKDGEIQGSFFLTACEDMHHGKVAVLAAHWIRPMARCKELHRLVMWYVKRFCATHGIRKYQRTINVSSSRQLLITKEVS